MVDASAPTGAEVRLIRPSCKAIIVPGSFDPGWGRSGGMRSGVTFTCQQTMR